jgi:hypothetical protein
MNTRREFINLAAEINNGGGDDLGIGSRISRISG